ncbi:hypothetical protein P7L78_08330 [Tistrella bauzanensis]|uniref:hypothetical protein n=1 Tax=Tistrella TaxID=171436 RepID=UPI0031F68F90
MSTGGGYLFRGLIAGARLACFDRRAMALLPSDVTGFWRSFWALPLALPGYLLLYSLPNPAGIEDPVPGDAATADVIATVASTSDGLGVYGDVLLDLFAWASFPLLLLIMARRTGVARGFVTYVPARNWLSLVQVYLMVGVIALAAASPPALAGLVTTLALAALIAMEWFMTRLTLGLSSAVVTLIVLLSIFWPIVLARLV